jgi:hypothetical protein
MKTIYHLIFSLLLLFISAGDTFSQQLVQGQRLPRLTTEKRDQILVDSIIAKGLIIYNTDADRIEFWDGSAWGNFGDGVQWFYMPTVVIDVSTSGKFSINLYNEYLKQFSSSSIKKSDGAPNLPVTKIYESDELYYYVIGFDHTVFPEDSISINKEGVMSYEVVADNVTDGTFMNIVFVIK